VRCGPLPFCGCDVVHVPHSSAASASRPAWYTASASEYVTFAGTEGSGISTVSTLLTGTADAGRVTGAAVATCRGRGVSRPSQARTAAASVSVAATPLIRLKCVLRMCASLFVGHRRVARCPAATGKGKRATVPRHGMRTRAILLQWRQLRRFYGRVRGISHGGFVFGRTRDADVHVSVQ